MALPSFAVEMLHLGFSSISRPRTSATPKYCYQSLLKQKPGRARSVLKNQERTFLLFGFTHLCERLHKKRPEVSFLLSDSKNGLVRFADYFATKLTSSQVWSAVNVDDSTDPTPTAPNGSTVSPPKADPLWDQSTGHSTGR